MPCHEETRILPYSVEEMFAVVADVERYPEFVPGCAALTVTARRYEGEAELLTAKMRVAYGALHESYTSLVRLDRGARTIEVHEIEGPFARLDTNWTFVPCDTGCEVRFRIEFAFESRFLTAVSEFVFERMARRMAGAFAERADALYGVSDHSQQ